MHEALRPRKLGRLESEPPDQRNEQTKKDQRTQGYICIYTNEYICIYICIYVYTYLRGIYQITIFPDSGT